MSMPVLQCKLCNSRFDSDEPQKYCPNCCDIVLCKRWALGALIGLALFFLWIILTNPV